MGYVHLRRQVSAANNEFSTKTGKGSEMWALLSPGDVFNHTGLGLTVTFCEIVGDLATVTVGKDVGETKRRCPNWYSSNGTLTTKRPKVPNRCSFVEMPGKRVSGYNYKWVYPTFEEAKYKCNKELTCTGIYQSQKNANFEVRTSDRWG